MRVDSRAALAAEALQQYFDSGTYAHAANVACFCANPPHVEVQASDGARMHQAADRTSTEAHHDHDH